MESLKIFAIVPLQIDSKWQQGGTWAPTTLQDVIINRSNFIIIELDDVSGQRRHSVDDMRRSDTDDAAVGQQTGNTAAQLLESKLAAALVDSAQLWRRLHDVTGVQRSVAQRSAQLMQNSMRFQLRLGRVSHQVAYRFQDQFDDRERSQLLLMPAPLERMHPPFPLVGVFEQRELFRPPAGDVTAN